MYDEIGPTIICYWTSIDFPGGHFGSGNSSKQRLFSAKYTTDLEVGYQVFKNLLAAVGGRNIFDAFPDKIANTKAAPIYSTTGGESDGEFYPRTGGPFGFNGAFWYVRLSATF